ncbi:MAG: methyltransferase [Arenimonas sp. SCN 70-307]|uniref:class I SAM-dependent methyltransferase n=1 Tax=Arenimonas sp. SCN 70-307 TaxID=1660089 RepID=UPI00086C2997|nr:class I SAM-dependent methyltransferase [Arenimonas sp. SCN 70-307]ODS63240.1 MAG: methyltransferase [Arenimonas sp. SCN 70-307]
MHQDSDPASSNHWEDVYRTKSSDKVSWYRPHLDISIDLLSKAGASPHSRVIDVGGGASTLVDDLLELGVANITVLDLSEQALALARQRLGNRGSEVRWMCADILTATLPDAGFDLWHDRAVLHFLTTPASERRYAEQAARSIRSGGQAVIGGFAPDGPERCSGLEVARRSAQDIAAVLGDAFELVEERYENHTTPGGTTQAFAWARLRRLDGG